MRKVHGKIKHKRCIRSHLNGAKEMRENRRKASVRMAKIGKK